MHLVILALPLLATVAIIALVVRFGRDAQIVRLSPPDAGPAQLSASRVQRRNRFAALVGLLAGVATGVLGFGLHGDLGRIALLAPTAGAIVAVLVFVIVPSAEFLESDAVRSAELTRRRPSDFARVWPAYAAAVALAVITVLLGLLGAPDGRSISHDYGDAASTAGPYPGWYYGVPLLIAAMVLSALTDWALRRVAGAPRPSDPALREADEAVRSLAVRLVVGICTASILLSLGAVLVGAGGPTIGAAGGVQASVGGVDASVPPFVPLLCLGIVELAVGLVAIVGGVTVLLLAVRRSNRRAFTVGVSA